MRACGLLVYHFCHSELSPLFGVGYSLPFLDIETAFQEYALLEIILCSGSCCTSALGVAMVVT